MGPLTTVSHTLPRATERSLLKENLKFKKLDQAAYTVISRVIKKLIQLNLVDRGKQVLMKILIKPESQF